MHNKKIFYLQDNIKHNDMELTAKQIAEHISGTIEGNPEAKARTVARIESGKPGSLCFLANPKYEHYLYTCKADIIIINRSFQLKEPVKPTLIRVDDSYQAIASLLDLFNTMKADRRSGRSWRAKISWRAKLGRKTYVGAGAVIEKGSIIGDGTQIYPQAYIGRNVRIGKDCVIYPGVKIYRGCVIGNNCVIHANTVIGSDGFGFAPTADGTYKKIPQTGNVMIEDDVEIGANTVIDRSTMGSTIIRKGAKLDNLIQIAHNVEIGENTVMAAQAGVAGSAKIGKHCQIGGQVGIAGHLGIADGTRIAAQSGIISTIKEENTAVMGSPAFNHSDYIRAYAIFRKLHKSK